MIVKRIFLFLLPCLFLLGCSIDFTDPEKVINSYYKTTFQDKDSKKSYKYLSTESQKHTTFDEYQKALSDKFKQRQIVSINILPEDSGKPAYRRAKVIYEINDRDKTFKDITYYTLINEDGKWKILWLWVPAKLADGQYMKGFYQEAIKQFEEILLINPYYGTGYNAIAWCYIKLGEREKALENIKTAIALEPDRRIYYLTMAVYHDEVEQRADLAIEDVKKAISFEYGSDFAKSNNYKELSKYYLKQKDYENALNAIDKAIEVDDSNASAYWKKAEILQGSSGQTTSFNPFDESSKKTTNINLMEKLTKLLQKAVEVNEKNDEKLAPDILPDLYYQLAVAEAYLDDYINAKKHLLKVLELKPDDNQAKMLYDTIEIAKWNWFFAPEGTIKEFELRLSDRAAGKSIETFPKPEVDKDGNIIIGVRYKSQLGNLNTKGFTIYKLDTKSERILQMATRNETIGFEEVWLDYDYIIMTLPLTTGKEWEYKFERTKIPLETYKTEGGYIRYKRSGEVVTHKRKVIGKEKIRVPAGEFETIAIQDEGMGEIEYYAKNIGLVAVKSRNAISKEWWISKRLTKLSKQK